jgi:DNA polymerase IV
LTLILSKVIKIIKSANKMHEGKVDRNIVHMDLDSFFVSVEVLQNSELKGKPLLIGGNSNRGVVASCSYEARKYGIHSAMPMKMARRLCPHAIILGGDSERYSYFSKMVTEVVSEAVPMYEKSSIDEFYIDLTGMDRFFGAYQLATELRQRITRETGLPISFGFSSNKTVSKIATNESKPNGQMQVYRGLEKGFLSPLTVNKIPQVGAKTYHLLRNMGVERVLTLQQMPIELLENVLGKSGHSIWMKAQGIDHTPVIPYSERKSISAERTFMTDTTDMALLNSTLIAMTEKLAYKLRTKEKLTACVTVKVRYSDFDTQTTQKAIPYTANDDELIKVVKELFLKLYQRRVLLRLVGVRFSHLVNGGCQINLFSDTSEQINLYQAIDRMKKRFGDGSLTRAVALGIKQYDVPRFKG